MVTNSRLSEGGAQRGSGQWKWAIVSDLAICQPIAFCSSRHQRVAATGVNHCLGLARHRAVPLTVTGGETEWRTCPSPTDGERGMEKLELSKRGGQEKAFG